MTTAQISEHKNLYRVFRALSDEPPLNDDEEEGLRISNAELAKGEGRSFRDAMKELW